MPSVFYVKILPKSRKYTRKGDVRDFSDCYNDSVIWRIIRRSNGTVKNLVICIKNRLLAESIEIAFLKQAYRVERVGSFELQKILSACEAVKADVLLMDVSRTYGNTLEMKLDTVRQIKAEFPDLKVAVICDTTSDEAIADKVKTAKQTGQIDGFYFESVTADYLVASIDTL